MALQPYADTAFNDNNGNVSPDIEVVIAVVPVGKLLVVEHVSGRLAVRDGAVVDFIQAAAQGQDSVVSCQCILYQVWANSVLRKVSVDFINSAHRPGFTCTAG